MLCILIFFSILLGLIMSWYYNFFKYNRYFSKYKGPTPLPVIGNLHQFTSPNDYLQIVMDFHKQYGLVIKTWFAYRPKLIISDHQIVKDLLGSTTIREKSYDYNFIKRWIGDGLLVSKGEKWKRHRKLLTPAFHFKILEQFIDIFDAQSNILVEKLSTLVNKGPFDVFPYISLFALDAICEATMGTQVNAQVDTDSRYVQYGVEICRIVFDRTISLFKSIDFFYVFTKDYWKQQKALSFLHGYSMSVIQSRQHQLNKASEHKISEEDDLGVKKRKAFIDILLECRIDGAPLPLDEIREEVDTFMFEGQDTITSAISFVLYCLSVNPNVQKKVVDELKSIFGNDKNKPSTYQNLQDMKYLEMVIKESMRLYPPVPLYHREAKQDSQLGETFIPKGTSLLVFAYGIHRQEGLFPNPEIFDPERFTVENSNKRSPYAYVPFSAGPRNCIGQRFAMIEMKATLSKILKHYIILPVDNYKPKVTPDIIMKSSNGILIALTNRDL